MGGTLKQIFSIIGDKLQNDEYLIQQLRQFYDSKNGYVYPIYIRQMNLLAIKL